MIRRSLIRLTLQYSLLLLGLFAVFSIFIYVYMVQTFDSDYHHTVKTFNRTYKHSTDVAAKNGAEDATDEGVDRLREVLIISYGALVIVVPIISYGLARRSLRPVIRSYNAQQQFVDNASHELRTPLSRIQGELELAVSGKRTAGQYKEAINLSLKEVDVLVKMVSNLLLFARGTSKEVKGSHQEVKLQSTIHDALESIKATYATSTPTIVNNIRRRPILVTATPKLLEQALINVLDNSVKFTPITGSINIDAQVDSSKVVLKVADNGRGMSPEQIAHAFDRFWRAEDSESVMGHGLGLAFAKQVIEAHQGTAAIIPNKGGGITFEITLPLAPKTLRSIDNGQ